MKAISTAKCAAVLAVASVGLSGCLSTTPQWDEKFGDAIDRVRTAQILHPVPDGADAQPPTLDGAAAVSAQGQYQQSFANPPEPKPTDTTK